MLRPSSFKVKVEGNFRNYGPETNGLLSRAYIAGFPSVRAYVGGQFYKFDFKRMKQRNLYTGEDSEMLAPIGAPKKEYSRLFGERSVLAVRVAPGSAGDTVKVPHPRKLGKALTVDVPIGATSDQIMFVVMPRQWKKKFALTSAALGFGGGAAVGAAAAAGGNAGIAGGATAAGGAIVAVGLPALLAGGAVLAAVGGTAAMATYAYKNPGKAAVVGLVGAAALTIASGEEGALGALGEAAETGGTEIRAAADAVGGEVVDCAIHGDECDSIICSHFSFDLAEDAVDLLDSLFS